MFFCILLCSRQLCQTKCIFSEAVNRISLIHAKPNEEMHFVEESDADVISASQCSKRNCLDGDRDIQLPTIQKKEIQPRTVSFFILVLIAGRKKEQILVHLKPSFSVTANDFTEKKK
ncbi:hypothetical protein Pint_03274 [Pistacia integerrima]|uniref:Uncharacterized protein n=1 Tax=Pistacia integerrima TaxID=434235 RepID=A0ACC0ZMG7_9ROSI|nr:hypothetical protein Pint_03274 [Pistacia integerrima]